MDTFRAIIEHIGIPAFSKLVGVCESHVRVMKTRNSVPAEYWGVIVENYPEITYGQLREMRDTRFAKNEGTAA
jgi:hypothetical protein